MASDSRINQLQSLSSSIVLKNAASPTDDISFERKCATFDVDELSFVLNGGKEQLRRKWVSVVVPKGNGIHPSTGIAILHARQMGGFMLGVGALTNDYIILLDLSPCAGRSWPRRWQPPHGATRADATS